MLYDAINNPEYTPTTQSDQAVLDELMRQTHAAAAMRGLGPATQSSLSTSIAPTLQKMRQQRISNLLASLTQDMSSQLTMRGQDVTQRGQDIQSILSKLANAVTMRGQDIGSDMAMLQYLLQLRNMGS